MRRGSVAVFIKTYHYHRMAILSLRLEGRCKEMIVYVAKMPDINRSLLLTSLHNTLFNSLKVLHIHTQMHCDSSTSVFGF